MTRKSLSLLVTGLFIISLSQVIIHLTPVSDLVNGTMIGAGIGLMCIAIIFRQNKLTS